MKSKYFVEMNSFAAFSPVKTFRPFAELTRIILISLEEESTVKSNEISFSLNIIHIFRYIIIYIAYENPFYGIKIKSKSCMSGDWCSHWLSMRTTRVNRSVM